MRRRRPRGSRQHSSCPYAARKQETNPNERAMEQQQRRASTSCRTSPLALFSLSPSPCRSRHLLVLSTFRLSSNIHSVQEVSCFSQVFAKFREGLRTGSPSSSLSSSLRSLFCLLSLTRARTQHTHTQQRSSSSSLVALRVISPRRERERERTVSTRGKRICAGLPLRSNR